MPSKIKEASSNGNTVSPVTGPSVAKRARNVSGGAARHDGTSTVWLSRAPPANAAVVAVARVLMPS